MLFLTLLPHYVNTKNGDFTVASSQHMGASTLEKATLNQQIIYLPYNCTNLTPVNSSALLPS